MPVCIDIYLYNLATFIYNTCIIFPCNVPSSIFVSIWNVMFQYCIVIFYTWSCDFMFLHYCEGSKCAPPLSDLFSSNILIHIADGCEWFTLSILLSIYLFDISSFSINLVAQHEILVFSHGISIMKRGLHSHGPRIWHHIYDH